MFNTILRLEEGMSFVAVLHCQCVHMSLATAQTDIVSLGEVVEVGDQPAVTD